MTVDSNYYMDVNERNINLNENGDNENIGADYKSTTSSPTHSLSQAFPIID